MKPSERYIHLKKTLLGMAWRMSNGHESLADELMSVADLAVGKALMRPWYGKGDLSDWLTLRARNAMLDFLKAERAHRSRTQYRCPDSMDSLYKREEHPPYKREEHPPYKREEHPLDIEGLTSDAMMVVMGVLESYDGGVPHRALERALDGLYSTLGWSRTWRAVAELREAYAGG